MSDSREEPRGRSAGHAGSGSVGCDLAVGTGRRGLVQPLAREQPARAGREVSGWALSSSPRAESLLARDPHVPNWVAAPPDRSHQDNEDAPKYVIIHVQFLSQQPASSSREEQIDLWRSSLQIIREA